VSLVDRVQAAVARAEGASEVPAVPAVVAGAQGQMAGYFWNDAKFCEPCLKVLDGNEDFHLDLVPPAEEMDYDPTLRTGKQVAFNIDGERYEGTIERRQTFYQVGTLLF
jgi:hypothetical protein